MVASEALRRYEILWEYSLALVYFYTVTEEEASQKDWDIYIFLSSETRREVSGDFQVDLQDQACCREIA
jgi:hypothetical protein